MAWSNLVDMALTEDEKTESQLGCCCPMPAQEYPWGLCITLTSRELKMLGLPDDPEKGDLIDIRAFAEVKSWSKDDSMSSKDGPSCTVTLQIIRMAVESEMDEPTASGADSDDRRTARRRTLYDKTAA